MAGADGLLVDIDGVLTTSWRAIPGAIDALARLRADGMPLALVTNTTSQTRHAIVAALLDAGFDLDPDDVLTTVSMTARHLRRHHPGARVLLLTSGDLSTDLDGLDLMAADDAGRPDVVVLGGAGPEFGYEAVNRVFAFMHDGVPTFAMNPNLVWQTAEGLQLDTGAYLVGLEAAAGVSAEVLGKPSPAFFQAALDHVGVAADRALMVGDDLQTDVLGAQACGIRGVLVRTGKFRPELLERSVTRPDHVVGSFADVPDLLGALG